MQTLTEVVNKIQEAAKANAARPREQKTHHLPVLKVGQNYQQGDLYIFKVADNHPVGEVVNRRQIADGQSIGQRHILVGEFIVYKGIEPPLKEVDELFLKARAVGYAFDVISVEGDVTRNVHPEHDQFVFHQTGRFQVWHQCDKRTLDRVAD